jgi:hypothetical protein
MERGVLDVTNLGYIVFSSLIALTIISIVLCKLVGEEDLKNVSILVLVILLAIIINISF